MLIEEIKVGDKIVVYDMSKLDVSLETVKVISKIMDSCNDNEKGKFLFHTEKDARCSLNEYIEDVVLGVLSPDITNGAVKMFAIDDKASLVQNIPQVKEQEYFKCPLYNCDNFDNFKDNHCVFYDNVNDCGSFKTHLNVVDRCSVKSCSQYSNLETNHCREFVDIRNCNRSIPEPKKVKNKGDKK